MGDTPPASPPDSDSDDFLPPEAEDYEDDLPPPEEADEDDDLSLPSLGSMDDEIFFRDDDEDIFDDDVFEDDLPLSDPDDSLSNPGECTPWSDPEDEWWSDSELPPPSDEDEPESPPEPVSPHKGPPQIRVCVSEHPRYAKYFKMLKFGLPQDVVVGKVIADGLDAKVLELPPAAVVELSAPAIPLNLPPSRGAGPSMHPLNMLPPPLSKLSPSSQRHPGSHLPSSGSGSPPPSSTTVRSASNVTGAADTTSTADRTAPSSSSAPPSVDTGEKVPVCEHESYAKYFRMLKVGLPKDVVKSKMVSEGLDPAVLDMNPAELIGVNDIRKYVPDTKKANPLLGELKKKMTAGDTKEQLRKKKLFWNGIDKLDANSLWADGENADIAVDMDEFNRLFVEATTTKVVAAAAPKTFNRKPKGVQLISLKRAQNAAIALARIKMSYEQLRDQIMRFSDENLSTELLRALVEFLPDEEEQKILRSFKGDEAALGKAERYMMCMLHCPGAASKMGCMIYKQSFQHRWHDSKVKLSKIEQACDDVKSSVRLKKVLKIILKVGNQLNEGEEHKGFTLDSLLKLSTTKAFDKKTSVLQYVIMLINRNDADMLAFPEDLSHVADASRVIFEGIASEKSGLRFEYENYAKFVTPFASQAGADNTGGHNSGVVSIDREIVEFYSKVAVEQCDELEKKFQKVKQKYVHVLTYFGESANMICHEFFTTLCKFMSEFSTIRDNVIRLQKQEERRLKAASLKATKSVNGLGGNGERRASLKKSVSMPPGKVSSA